ATLAADQVHPARIDAALVLRMRASVLLLGALLGRAGEATLPMPGGDAIGLRGVDFHISGLTAMGAEIAVESGQIRAQAPGGLHGADIVLPLPSVGATENLMLAAVLARGETTIRNAALEPEIVDLALCLSAMGARITGAGTDLIRIQGGAPLSGAVHHVMPDRIETGTLACAAAMTGGCLNLIGARLDLLGAAAPVFAAAGVALEETQNGIVARRAPGGLRGIAVQTRPYPGFATDLQAPAMALLTVAEGASDLTETIFEQRFRHVDELRKMGASIQLQGRVALIRGRERLTGARVTGHDVRAAAALVLAGLAADGETVLDGLDHLDRGYDGMVEKLIACGAHIRPST
ncbi:MAG TPA: UDP-N-acetylglucosamine 1-carboxyvinyltransferase, partial [Acidisoma sp.]|nr:UDP-N-acetylglucosamine 1-carboxyvinyltransferase [Acidisoma sp.]